MKIHIRIEEDWPELAVALGLIYVTVSAIRKCLWFVAILAIVFLGATVYLWWKQVKSRWCNYCQKPMRRILERAHDYERIVYICETCGQCIDSGLQSGHPE